MSIIYIVSDNSLESFYEDSMQYLFEKYHPHSHENDKVSVSKEMEQSAFFAEAFLTNELPDHIPKKIVTRRDRIF
jgi:hypothetical protein